MSELKAALRATGKITVDRKNGSGRPRGYVPWSPQKKTLVVLERVFSIIEEYRDHWPITNRQILYRMMGKFGYSKDFEGRLYNYLERARRAEMIPFAAIRDDGVVTCSPKFYAGPEAFWDEVGTRIDGYLGDRQEGQPKRIELWCEAAGMLPQLTEVANEYSVKTYTNGRTCSISAVRQIVDRARRRNVPTVLLHVGDFDPYGENIFNALVEDAQAFLEKDRIIGTQRIEPVRVALTAEQLEEFELPIQPTKKAKGGSKAHETIRRSWIERYGDRTCQAEALPPNKLAEVVRDAIELQIVRFDTYVEQVEKEPHDQIQMRRALPAGDAS